MKDFLIISLSLIIVQFIIFVPVLGNEYKKNTLITEWSPKSVIISPDGEKAYVLNLEACSVTVYDTHSEELLYTLYLPQNYATGWDYDKGCAIPSIAEKPVEGIFTEDRYLWMSLHNGSCVFVYDTENKSFIPPIYNEKIKIEQIGKIIFRFWKYYLSIPSSVEATIKNRDGETHSINLLKIPAGKVPKVIAHSSDGKYIAVANWHGYSVTIIDAKRFKVISTVPVSTIPRGMVFTRDSKLLYVAIMGSNHIEIIDMATWKVAKRIDSVGYAPRHLIIDREGRYIYCSNTGSGNLVRIDVSTDKLVSSVPVGLNLRTIEFSPDEKEIYVCSYDENKIYVVDVEEFKVIDSLETGEDPVGVSVSPDGKIWVANQGNGSVTVFRGLNGN